jgi:hypothetical protein
LATFSVRLGLATLLIALRSASNIRRRLLLRVNLGGALSGTETEVFPYGHRFQREQTPAPLGALGVSAPSESHSAAVFASRETSRGLLSDRLEQVARLACYLRDTRRSLRRRLATPRRNWSETFMSYKFLLITVILLTFADPALANWWIVRAADEKCLVVDIEPSGKDVTKVGKDVYQTREQAEADVKGLCKESNAAAPPSTPGNAE